MLLIFLSSTASSLLIGSLGLERFFSLGTSLARGWRWPIGASGIPPPLVAPGPPGLLLCAIAAGEPISIRSAIEMIAFFMLRPCTGSHASARRVQMHFAAIVGHTITCFFANL